MTLTAAPAVSPRPEPVVAPAPGDDAPVLSAVPSTEPSGGHPAATPVHVLGSRVSSAPTTMRHWVPKPSGGPDPVGHLTTEQIDELGRELDAIREGVLASRGAADAAYIRRVIEVQRKLELGSRVVLLFSGSPVAWVLGTAGLSVAKILENMEIGHNVLHGQWDWMRDPKIHSRTWEWDIAAPSHMWKHSHNELHHTWTNVIGRDNDLGYHLLRVDPDQPWEPKYLYQPFVNLLNAIFFQYGVALYDLDLERSLGPDGTEEDRERVRRDGRAVALKAGRHALRDYVLHPLVSGPNALSTLAANAVANLVRNVWSNAVIVCGHFPAGVETFSEGCLEGETRGEWYVRQMLGSANIDGGPLIHLMSGNLSHQIEHHLFPDLPSNRYAEVAPRVRALCEKYGLHYVAGPMHQQYASVWKRDFEYALPNGAWTDLRERPVETVAKGARWAGTQLAGKARAKRAARREARVAKVRAAAASA